VVVEGGRVTGVQVEESVEGALAGLLDTTDPATESASGFLAADVVLANADYAHVEQALLEPAHRQYTSNYWRDRTLSPSSLLFYLGVEGRVEGLRHHTLFFDEDLDAHADAIYENPRWPERPLFYVSAPSKTDPLVAPDGHENLCILIPLAPNLPDPEVTRERYYDVVMDRLESLTNQSIRDRVVLKRSYAHTNFSKDYHALGGNAYGLANTLKQTAILRPRLRSNRVRGLYFAGQLTVPGPGVPPAIISGEVAARQIGADLGTQAGSTGS
jgi:phytoene desaturase